MSKGFDKKDALKRLNEIKDELKTCEDEKKVEKLLKEASFLNETLEKNASNPQKMKEILLKAGLTLVSMAGVVICDRVQVGALNNKTLGVIKHF